MSNSQRGTAGRGASGRGSALPTRGRASYASVIGSPQAGRNAPQPAADAGPKTSQQDVNPGRSASQENVAAGRVAFPLTTSERGTIQQATTGGRGASQQATSARQSSRGQGSGVSTHSHQPPESSASASVSAHNESAVAGTSVGGSESEAPAQPYQVSAWLGGLPSYEESNRAGSSSQNRPSGSIFHYISDSPSPSYNIRVQEWRAWFDALSTANEEIEGMVEFLHHLRVDVLKSLADEEFSDADHALGSIRHLATALSVAINGARAARRTLENQWYELETSSDLVLMSSDPEFSGKLNELREEMGIACAKVNEEVGDHQGFED